MVTLSSLVRRQEQDEESVDFPSHQMEEQLRTPPAWDAWELNKLGSRGMYSIVTELQRFGVVLAIVV
jgi:hypothetical protein